MRRLERTWAPRKQAMVPLHQQLATQLSRVGASRMAPCASSSARALVQPSTAALRATRRAARSRACASTRNPPAAPASATLPSTRASASLMTLACSKITNSSRVRSKRSTRRAARRRVRLTGRVCRTPDASSSSRRATAASTYASCRRGCSDSGRTHPDTNLVNVGSVGVWSFILVRRV